MEIHCKVNVVNRLLPAAGQSGPSRLIWANVTFSKNKLEVVELTLITSRSKSGTKYRVTDNVEQIFAKFISQGKLTVRFKQPQHDLCFSGEAKQMERIAYILKGGDANLQKGPLSIVSPNTSSKVVIPKTKLNITSRAEYPVINSFPESLVTLKIIGIQLKKVDRRILHLKHLEILDLSQNQISTLPETIAPLTKLKQLNLSHNEIKRLPGSFLKSSQLVSLDLSSNDLTQLPDTISSVLTLHTLKLDQNKLRRLPRTLCKLRNLRLLSLSSNQIPFLPASFQTLNLDHIDVFGNPFETKDLKNDLPTIKLGGRLSLLSVAAKAVINFRLKYTEGDIPLTLISYLNEASTVCPCGKICMDDGIVSGGTLNLLNISSSIVGAKVVPLELTLCSRNCYNRFAMNLLT